jgi:hypothetical protein
MKKILIIVFAFVATGLRAQDNEVDFVKDQAQNQEIYVHFDKSFYAGGETIWFSIYNVSADEHKLIFGRRFMEFAIVDQNKQVVGKERIRVLDGKSWGQFTLPSNIKTGNYLFIITYPFEDARNFLYRRVIPIFNLEDDFSSELPTSVPKENKFDDLPSIKNTESIISVTTDKENYLRRETITINLNLNSEQTAKASVVVRKRGLYADPLDIRSLGLDPLNQSVKNELDEVQLTNFRENKPLRWKLIDSHGLLLYELVQKDCLQVASIPYLYIPEDRTAHDIIEVKKGRYVFDATGLSGDIKSLYFTSFSFGKYGAVPSGEIKYDWLNRKANYNNILPAELMQAPKLTNATRDYLSKAKLRKEIAATYGQNTLIDESNVRSNDGMRYRTVIWKNVDEYTDMETLPEFLKEVVLGLKIWEKRGVFDLRIFYVGGRYTYAPFFLVNGVPTWDQQRVLEIPITDIYGVGIIKDLHTETGEARAARLELLNFGYYGANAIMSIELKPNVINPFQSEYNEFLKKRFYLAPEPHVTPNYTTGKTFSAPDFRPVLYWNPDVIFGKEGNPSLSFSASDDAGEYEVIVEGIGKNGDILYDKKVITIGIN